ncbi:hypothetical protein BGZ70_004702 [Mortierella alpina]|uniref:Uncharacterized protein n=1 Tax=Mortierella alpina TaxID=64518 RepID=A0A9P6JBY0_MORAP|nr:hypothetical protein BGZ70_004702 [Mortierella alpina]
MNVYIVTEMQHSDDYKRPSTEYVIKKVFRVKEEAYEFAHDQQLHSIQENMVEEDSQGRNQPALKTYSRDRHDPSWEVSYTKLMEVFEEILPEPEFDTMASHIRYTVQEHPVV